MDTVIPQNASLVLWSALIAITAVAMWMEKSRYGRLLGGPVIAIIIGFILGNTGVLPTQAPAYTQVDQLLLPLAIPLLLFHADINRILRESGPVLCAFIVAAVGTAVGVVIAFYLVPLPGYPAELAGTFAATYIGGGMNFAAVSQATGIPAGDILAAAIAADNIMTILFLFVLTILPALSWVTSKFSAEREHEIPDGKDTAASLSPGQRILGAFVSVAAAYVIMLLGNMIQKMTGWHGTGMLAITLIAVLAATFIPALKRFTGDAFVIGMILMTVFFASLGARADFVGTIDTAPVMFAFVAIVLAVHGAFMLGLGRILRLTLPEIVTASNACILGPATAAGLAANKGWTGLVTPGILVGTLGYALANFIGIGLANLLG